MDDIEDYDDKLSQLVKQIEKFLKLCSSEGGPKKKV